MTIARDVAELSAEFAKKLHEARTRLREEMDKLGLLEKDGWRIGEVTRECAGGSELVLRPLHFRLPSPDGLECYVRFVEQPLEVGAECAPASSIQFRR